MKIGVKQYVKYLVYVFAVLCLVFLLVFNLVMYPIKYKKEINKYSKIYNIDRSLIASVICVESSFNQNAISSKGAKGLMQIMPQTAKWICEKENIDYDEQKLLNAEYNINLGTYYLNYLINKFKNTDTAIIAYNAGEGVVSSWLKNEKLTYNGKIVNIPYKETSNYLTKINRAINIYKDRF